MATHFETKDARVGIRWLPGMGWRNAACAKMARKKVAEEEEGGRV